MAKFNKWHFSNPPGGPKNGWILPFPRFWALANVGFVAAMVNFQDRRPKMGGFLPFSHFRALGFSGFLGPSVFFKTAGQANFQLGGDLAVTTQAL